MSRSLKKRVGGKSRKGGRRRHQRRGGAETSGNCQAAWANANAGKGQVALYPGDYKQQQADFFSGKGGRRTKRRRGGRSTKHKRGGRRTKHRRGGRRTKHRRGGSTLSTNDLVPWGLVALNQMFGGKRKR